MPSLTVTLLKASHLQVENNNEGVDPEGLTSVLLKEKTQYKLIGSMNWAIVPMVLILLLYNLPFLYQKLHIHALLGRVE